MNRILVIEDDEALRGNIVDLLMAEGYHPIHAKDGEEGARLAWDWRPDLIICDILLPHLDGYGVLAKLSHDPTTATIPFIFLTALTGQEQMRKGMNLGADDFITKPFDLNDLLRVIELRLGKNRSITLQAQRMNSERMANLTARLPGEMLGPLTQIIRGARLLAEQGNLLEGDLIKNIGRQINLSAENLLHLTQNTLFLTEVDAILGDAARVLEYQRAVTNKAHELIADIAVSTAHQFQREDDLWMNLEEVNLKVSYDHLLKVMEEVLGCAFFVTQPGSVIHLTGKVLPNRDSYNLLIGNNGWNVENELLQQVSDSQFLVNEGSDELSVSLSLHIVRRLVDLYRGDISLVSKPGGGAQIKMVLPLATGFRQKV